METENAFAQRARARNMTANIIRSIQEIKEEERPRIAKMPGESIKELFKRLDAINLKKEINLRKFQIAKEINTDYIFRPYAKTPAAKSRNNIATRGSIGSIDSIPSQFVKTSYSKFPTADHSPNDTRSNTPIKSKTDSVPTSPLQKTRAKSQGLFKFRN